MKITKKKNNIIIKLVTYLNWQKISAYSVAIPIACKTVTLKVNSIPDWRWSGRSSSFMSLDTELSPLPLSVSPTSSSSLISLPSLKVSCLPSLFSLWPSTTRSSERICWLFSKPGASKAALRRLYRWVLNRSSSKDMRADCRTPLEYSLFSSSRKKCSLRYWKFKTFNKYWN